MRLRRGVVGEVGGCRESGKSVAGCNGFAVGRGGVTRFSSPKEEVDDDEGIWRGRGGALSCLCELDLSAARRLAVDFFSLSIPLRKADLLESLSDGEDESVRADRLLLGLLSCAREGVVAKVALVTASLLSDAIAEAIVGNGGARGGVVWKKVPARDVREG